MLHFSGAQFFDKTFGEGNNESSEDFIGGVFVAAIVSDAIASSGAWHATTKVTMGHASWQKTELEQDPVIQGWTSGASMGPPLPLIKSYSKPVTVSPARPRAASEPM